MSTSAVPILPIKKGSVLRLWIALGLIGAAGVGVAWFGTAKTIATQGAADQFMDWNDGQTGVLETASGLQYRIDAPGDGSASPTDADVVAIAYKGTLRDGSVFDQNPRATFPVQGLVPGFSEVLKLMSRGAKFKVWIPPALGYGDASPSAAIPANSVLIFDIEMVDFRSMAEVQAMQQQAQQQQAAGANPQQQPVQ